MSDEGEQADSGKEVRLMVEESTVTPFFARHKAHKPAEIKLHAELEEEDDFVLLKTNVSGYEDDLIDVSASDDTIRIQLKTGRSPKKVEGEAAHEDNVALNSSYYTPAKIDPEDVTVLRKGDTLVVKARKA